MFAVRRDGSDVALDSRVLGESERYLASADVEATRKNRREALHRVYTIKPDLDASFIEATAKTRVVARTSGFVNRFMFATSSKALRATRIFEP